MFRIKDEYLNTLEVNRWKRWRNKLIRILISPYRFIRSLCLVTGALFWLSVVVLGVGYSITLHSLPDFNLPENSSQLNLNSPFDVAKKAAKERVMAKHLNSNIKFMWTPLKDVHRELLYAIVMSEDSDFFSHRGVDYDALINAIGENIKRRQWSFGASSISQQTIKNIYLSEEKTLYRKLQELLATRRMEAALEKNEILELYFNIIEFGPDLYGIHAASQYYFRKKPSQLNAAEGAFLAILMPSPRKYHFTIFQNQYMAKQHRNKYKRILQDMRFKHYISPEQYARYIKWSFFK